MVVAFSVTIDDEHSQQFSRAVVRQIQTATYRAIADRWQTKWLPRHFTRRAREIYGYRKRSKKWQARKEREAKHGGNVKKGGRVDLVYRGLAERLFSKKHAIRAFPTRASVNMHGPRYVTMLPKKGNSNAIGPEILQVVSEEMQDMDRTGQVTLEALMKKAPRRKRKIKGR